jgi:ribulose-phosphate 3-epimerase
MVDLVLVLSVNPGYSGQQFLPEVLPKISNIRRLLEKVNPEVWLEVDGGINSQTLPQVIEAGANVFVAAHAIFDHPGGIAAGVRELRSHMPG